MVGWDEFAVSWASSGQLGLITFRNPYLNDSLTSMQLDVYRSATNYITYFERKTGASVTFGRWFSEYVSEASVRSRRSSNYSNPTGNAPALITSQVGHQTTTGFRTSLARDTRDYYYGSPHRLANLCRI